MSLAKASRSAVVHSEAPDWVKLAWACLSCGFECKTYDPGVLQRNHVVNVHVAGSGPAAAIVGAGPCARSRIAVAAGLNAGAITAQNILAVENLSVGGRGSTA